MIVADGVPDSLVELLRGEGLDTVDGALAYDRGEALTKPGLGGRRRTRLSLTDEAGQTHELYLKRYEREPFGRRVRRWLTQGRFASPAGVEFENIRAVRAAGVPAMQPIAWGEDPARFGAKRSYVIVSPVPGESLERCGEGFIARCGERAELIDELTGRLCRLVRTLHGAGYVHRDLYASHVFLDFSGGQVELSLIDLARAFRPRWRRFRWQVKDLAQLKYSMPSEWVRRCWDGFLREYLAGDEERRLRRWSRAIDRKVARMGRRVRRRTTSGGKDQP